MAATLSELLKRMVEFGGSDLHITTNSPPQVRIHGHLQPLDLPQLTAADTKALAYSVMTDAQKHRFEEDLELDFSFGLKGLARFRANCFNQRGACGAVFRVIPYEIKSFQQLALPPVVSKFCEKPRGLILVTGPTGSGKSTTLAAMLDKINSERHEHILTIEDPIEFVHQHKACLVNQREVHADTKSFTAALRAALREDPDVVLIGEMRDLGNNRVGAANCRNGSLDLWNTAHQFGGVDDQPYHRRFSGSPAAANPRPALDGAGRDSLPGTIVESGRPGPRDGHGNPDTKSGRPEPDSRRQNSPDLFSDAIGTGQIRHADLQPVACHVVFPETNHAGNSNSAFVPA